MFFQTHVKSTYEVFQRRSGASMINPPTLTVRQCCNEVSDNLLKQNLLKLKMKEAGKVTSL